MEGYDFMLMLLLIAAFYWDTRWNMIPNWLTVSGSAFGVIYHLTFGGWEGFAYSVSGMIVSGVLFLLLYLFRAVGAGDVKLFAAIGAITGMQFTLYVMMYSIVYAGIIGVLILLFTRTFAQQLFQAGSQLFLFWLSRDFKGLDNFQKRRSTRFAFMYAVAPGVVTTYYYFTF